MNALLIDIGNTRIKWRRASLDVGSGGAVATEVDGDADHAIALADVDTLADRWRPGALRPVDAALVSNVAHPDVEARVVRAVTACWPTTNIERIVPRAREGGVVNGYDDARRLGPDRWLALIGGHALLPDRTLLVCTFGTATTIDLLTVVDAPNRPACATFVGGLILPGFDAMRASLARTTARLPDARGAIAAFATNTVDSIASGVAAAQVGAVEHAIADARLLSAARPLTCLFAGGALPEIAPLLDRLAVSGGVPGRVVTDLVLRGLASVARERFAAAGRDSRPSRVASIEDLAADR